MNNRIDYSNIKKLTNTLKSNLAEKYRELGKINQDAAPSNLSSSNVGSAAISEQNQHQDQLDTLFNQNTFNGNIIINGGITADYIETSASQEKKYTDCRYQTGSNRILENRGIFDPKETKRYSNLTAGSISVIERNTVINNPTINNPRIDNPEFSGNVTGLDDIFSEDYIELYSIETNKKYFDVHTKEVNNGVVFTYANKNLNYLTLDWNSPNDPFGNAWTQGYTNNFFKSEFSNVHFKPRTSMDSNSKFKIENMGVEISNNLSVPQITSLDINSNNIIVGNEIKVKDLDVSGVLTATTTTDQTITDDVILFTSTDEGHIIVKSKQLQDDKDLDFIAFNRTSQFTLRADAQGNDKLTIDQWNHLFNNYIGKTIGIERTIGDEINSISSNIITTINITTTGDNVDAIVDIMLIEDELPDKLRIGADNKNFNLPTIFANDTFNINPDLGYTESLQYYIYNDTEFNIKDYKSDLNLIANGDIKIKAGGDLTLDITGEFIQEVGQSQQVGSKLVVNNNAEFNGSLTTFSGQVKFSGEIERTESAEIFTTAVKTITTSQPLVGLGVGGLSTEGFNIGFYGEYQINGVNKYTGLIRDRTSKDYILFNDLDYTPQPEATITPSS